MIHHDTLLQKAADIITKWEIYFITKYDRSLLQNASGFLLQNATVLLENATVITNCGDFITKCDSYYKVQCLLQTATIHSPVITKNLTLSNTWWLLTENKMWRTVFSQSL